MGGGTDYCVKFIVPSTTDQIPFIFVASLEALTDQVVGKTLDSRAGVAGNLGLAVLADDNGLLRLGNGDTVASLDGGCGAVVSNMTFAHWRHQAVATRREWLTDRA